MKFVSPITFSDGSGNPYMQAGPENLVTSQSPWDPSGGGVNNLRGSLEMKQETAYESQAEFMVTMHFNATKGHSGLASYTSDKVAFAPTITATTNNASCWAMNPITTAYSGASTDCSYFGAEFDLNNLTGRHYGDVAPVAAGGDFIGIFVTGIGTYRMSAGVLLANTVDHAWNAGYVVFGDCISITGPAFVDYCNGHLASLDIRGAPTYGIRQQADGPTTRNWFNAPTLFGINVGTQAQSRVHVEGGAVGGAVNNFIEVFRRASTVDADSIMLRETVYRIHPNTSVSGAASALYRQGFYVGGTAESYYDFYADGTVQLNQAAGDVWTAAADRTFHLGSDVYVPNMRTAPGTGGSGALYRDSSGYVRWS